MSFFFFFNDTATTEIYTLSLHDALPIYSPRLSLTPSRRCARRAGPSAGCLLPLLLKTLQQVGNLACNQVRSEEHTSELQSLAYLVCRLLLEKKKKNNTD